MSLWAEYQSELLGAETIETDDGFVTFFDQPDAIYISELYVRRDRRSARITNGFRDQIEAIARERGKLRLISSVKISTNTCSKSLMFNLAHGFVPFLAESGIIWLKKEI